MKKTMRLIAVLVAFVMTFWAAGAFAIESVSKGWDRPHQVGEMIGKFVKNSQGERVGRVKDFVFGPEGRIEFVILSAWGFWGGKSVAVPFEAFQYDNKRKHMVLDISREKLESVPAFERDKLGKQEWTEGIYRHYGLQPYWTEKESEGSIHEGGMERQR